MARVIVFDVNETLLDIGALRPHFERSFGEAAIIQEWFVQVLATAFVSAITNVYTDFGTVGRHALEMVAARRGVVLTEDDRTHILAGMLSLPPHPEVTESLERLRKAGLRLVALTNSTTKAAQTQLTNAGLIDNFEAVMSVETVQRFKPAAEVYHMAAAKLGVDISKIRMVAAHDWDVSGAIRAGAVGAFVARPGMVLGPLSERPDIIGRDMDEVADQILRLET